jgi:hypothetical protein
MKKLPFIILLIVACSVSGFTQTKKFRLDIRSISSDTQIKDEMYSYLARELRSLGDVEVVDQGDFTLNVHVVKITDKNGLAGYAVSSQFLEKVYCQGKVFANRINGGLHVVEPDGLRKFSETIVATFDAQVLEERRKTK